MKIDFIDLKAQQRKILSEIENRISAVLAHGKYILGPEVFELEEKLASYVGVKYAITCSSGTDALLMPLMALGIGPRDAVFTTPFTFIATAEVIALLGATPVFVDIDPRSFNIDSEKLAEQINRVKDTTELNPKAIIPVDLFGLPADYDSIMAIGGRHGLFVLEDAAQSLGANYKERLAGNLAHAAATSFFPAKPLGCYGDGGAVFTDDSGLAETLYSIRVHGKGIDKYDNLRVGLNARLDTLQAAILLAKMEIFPQEVETRQRVAQAYTAGLAELDRHLVVPYVPKGIQSVWAQYSLLAEKRDELIRELKKEDIPTMIYYPKPLHLQSAFAGLGYKKGDFPVAESTAERICSLPMHPYLSDVQQQRVLGVISEFFSR